MPDSDFSFALEDDLFLEYHKFTNPNDYPEGYDRNIIKHLLPYQVKQFRYNLRQYLTLGDKAQNRNLTNTLRHDSKCKDLTPEKLAEHTFYQCVLSISKDQFPYINIMSDGEKIRPTIYSSFYATQPRVKAVSHIKRLCERSKEIIIIDKYLNDDYTVSCLNEILPKNDSVQIVILKCENNSKADDSLRKCYPSWNITFEELGEHSHHDRYLIVDKKMEIIITSGLANLYGTQKDVTYIVKKASLDHLLP